MLYPRPFRNDDDFDRETDRDEFSSPEFEALAEQLGDDARMLAERYPAPSPAPLTSLVPTAGQRLSLVFGSARWRKVLAASVLVAAGMGTLLGTRLGDNKGEWAVDARQGKPDQNDQVVNESREPVRQQPFPAVSFQEFTGPEQEAVLDLLEENALSQGSLSI
jgi:hypothetical protein